jgi:hypothetical protein
MLIIYFSILEPIFNQYPLLNVKSLTNKTALIEIDWLKSFILNGPLIKYQVILNELIVYEGNMTNLLTYVNITECLPNKKFDLVKKTDYYFIINIRIKVLNDFFIGMSPDLEIPVNCSIEVPNFSFYKTSVFLDSWIGVVLFLIGFFILMCK